MDDAEVGARRKEVSKKEEEFNGFCEKGHKVAD